MGVQVTIAANAIDKGRLGYQSISLTHFNETAEPSISAGSKVEVGGALYEFTADETGASWAGIGNSNNVYIYLVPSGASISWLYSATAPTWSTSKQGWYNGSNRAVFQLYKDSGGLYTAKNSLRNPMNYAWQGKMIKLVTGATNPWTVPADVYRIKVWCVGGGGGGAAGNGSYSGGGGGGSVVPTMPTVIECIPGQTFAIVIGSGGSGGSSNDGVTGGATTFAGAVTGYGGAGSKWNGIGLFGRGAKSNPADGRPSSSGGDGGDGGGLGAGLGGTGGAVGGNATANSGAGGGGGGCNFSGSDGGNGAYGFIMIEY